MRVLGLLLIVSTLFTTVTDAQIVQSVTGKVVDLHSGLPIAYANVQLLGESNHGTVSDDQGTFQFEEVPLGRYELMISYVGYETMSLPEILVESTTEPHVVVILEESAFDLDEVTVKPQMDKKRAQNSMARVSARTLSMEEASRYAGGFDDPARLASAFAGVSSNIGNNGIVIRGNAPKYLQWNLEGMEIPNPNHFANLSVLGGGGLTAISSFSSGNADFITSAMPATYQNALSGAFDLNLRAGSTKSHHHNIQVGALGVDLSSEGPLGQGSGASYIFNYRYSTLALLQSLLPEEARGIAYQDLSFKLRFPSLKKGTLEIWGLGLLDKSGQPLFDDALDRPYETDRLKADIKQGMGALGANYLKSLSNKTSLHLKVASTRDATRQFTELLNPDMVLEPYNQLTNALTTIEGVGYLATRFSKRANAEFGVRYKRWQYDLLVADAPNTPGTLVSSVDERGSLNTGSVFTNIALALSPTWEMVAGLNAQVQSLSGQVVMEPRASITKRWSDKIQMGLAYGLHSRLEPLHYYLIRDDQGSLINNELPLTKAHHAVFNVLWAPHSDWLIKIEPYYQYLFDVPVVSNTSFSFINLELDWFLRQQFSSNGEGKNLGVDLTVEKYLSKGFYTLWTASVFKSTFRNEEAWYSTRFDRRIISNALFGKEFQFGKNRHKSLGLNIRFTYQGGQPYTPIDLENSREIQDVVFDENRPFSMRFDPSLVWHFTINYNISRPKVSHHFSLKMLNAGGYESFEGFRYNHSTNEVDAYREALVIPNVSYRISF